MKLDELLRERDREAKPSGSVRSADEEVSNWPALLELLTEAMQRLNASNRRRVGTLKKRPGF